MRNIGNKIREFREAAGVSQKKLGLALGLSDKAVSAYESGRTLPPLETLYRISEELNKPLKYFIIGEGDEQSVDEMIDGIQSKVNETLEEIRLLRETIAKK